MKSSIAQVGIVDCLGEWGLEIDQDDPAHITMFWIQLGRTYTPYIWLVQLLCGTHYIAVDYVWISEEVAPTSFPWGSKYLSPTVHMAVPRLPSERPK